jgi:hypothetical protein
MELQRDHMNRLKIVVRAGTYAADMSQATVKLTCPGETRNNVPFVMSLGKTINPGEEDMINIQCNILQPQLYIYAGESFTVNILGATRHCLPIPFQLRTLPAPLNVGANDLN